MFQSHSWDGVENTSSEDVGQLSWGQIRLKKNRKRILISFLATVEKNRWMFWWWWSMGFLAANQSKKVLEIQPSAVRKHETACVATPFQLSWLQFSSTWFGEEGSSPKNLAHLAQKTRNPSSPGVDNAAEKQGPCSQKKLSCCPQRKPSRRSPLKPRKKVPARLRCQKRRHNVVK